MRYRKLFAFPKAPPRTWQDLPNEVLIQIAAEVILLRLTGAVVPSAPKVDIDMGFSVVDKRCRAAFFEVLAKRFVITELRFPNVADDQDLKQCFDIFNINWPNLKKVCHPKRIPELSIITLSFVDRRTWKPTYRTAYALSDFSTTLLMCHAVASYHERYGHLTMEGHISNKQLVGDVTGAVESMDKVIRGLQSVRAINFPIDLSREFTQNLVSLLRNPGELESFIGYQLRCVHFLHSKGYPIHTLVPLLIQGICNTAKFYQGMLVLMPLSTGATRSQEIWMEIISLLFLGVSEYLFNRENTHKEQQYFMLKDNLNASAVLLGFIAIATTCSRNALAAQLTLPAPPGQGLSDRVLVLFRRFAQLSLALCRIATLPGFPISEIVRGSPRVPVATVFTVQSHLYDARDAVSVLTTALRRSQVLNEDVTDWFVNTYWDCAFQEVFNRIDMAIRQRGNDIQQAILTAPMTQFNRVPTTIWVPPDFAFTDAQITQRVLRIGRS